MEIIKDELFEVKEKFGDSRRSELVPNAEEFNPEDFYADEDMVITISHLGYIKRTPLTEFRTQGRGGVGSKGEVPGKKIFWSTFLLHQCTIHYYFSLKKENVTG